MINHKAVTSTDETLFTPYIAEVGTALAPNDCHRLLLWTIYVWTIYVWTIRLYYVKNYLPCTGYVTQPLFTLPNNESLFQEKQLFVFNALTQYIGLQPQCCHYKLEMYLAPTFYLQIWKANCIFFSAFILDLSREHKRSRPGSVWLWYTQSCT